MQGSSFETGIRAAPGEAGQVIPGYTGENVKITRAAQLWGDNTYGQLGVGTTGGAAGNSGVRVDNVKDISIGHGFIVLLKEAGD